MLERRLRLHKNIVPRKMTLILDLDETLVHSRCGENSLLAPACRSSDALLPPRTSERQRAERPPCAAARRTLLPSEEPSPARGPQREADGKLRLAGQRAGIGRTARAHLFRGGASARGHVPARRVEVV